MTTEQDYSEDIHRFVEEYGYLPTHRDFDMFDHYPNPKHIKNWKDLIEECEFNCKSPKKRDVNYIYHGYFTWFNERYYQQLLDKYLQLIKFVEAIVPKEVITARQIYEQTVVHFVYKDQKYAVSYFCAPIKEYKQKIDKTIEAYTDLGYEVINLNGNYRWWKRQINKALELDPKNNV
jgi:hypothetical protein